MRPLAVTSDAALVFYGALMLLAAVRGYAGCEVLAVSNWLLGRDDQIGCMPFWLRAPRPRATVHMATTRIVVERGCNVRLAGGVSRRERRCCRMLRNQAVRRSKQGQ
jgi:hypothetical protein